MRIPPALLVPCLVLTCSCAGPHPRVDRADTVAPEVITANNRAVGLMGRFDFAAARQAFAELAAAHPELVEVRVNLAIATLNRQEEGDAAAALEILDAVLTEAPDNLRARYCRALLLLYQGEIEAALEGFRHVSAADPNDAFAAYFAGQALSQLDRVEEALECFRRAAELDPYLRSAHYGAFKLLLRRGRGDEGQQALARFQQLADNPRAHMAEIKYTRMGPKASVVAIGRGQGPAIGPPTGALFEDPTDLAAGEAGMTPLANRSANLSAADMDGDGRLDLLAAGVLDPSTGRHNLILQGTAAGGFAVIPNHTLAAVSQVNAALWGDLDNDGLTDVYLCRSGPNQLWRQISAGRWEDATAATGAAAGSLDTVDGAILDADHDGDLDLLLIHLDGPVELLNNNRDGSFRRLAAESGLDVPAGARSVVISDLDGDRDVDLVVLRGQPPHVVLRNDLLWRYLPAAGFDQLCATPLAAAVAADTDVDGQVELYAIGPDGSLSRWQPDASGVWRAQRLLDQPSPIAAGARMSVAVLDVTGDGQVELLATTGATWTVWSLVEGGAIEPLFTANGRQITTWLPVLVAPDRGPAVVGLDSGSGLALWPAGPGRHGFAALALSGMEDPGQSLRSNVSGIGARVTVLAGSRWQVAEGFRVHSGPGQSLQPLAFGLGGAARLDCATIDWSDGVFQSELELEAGQLHRIVETQRQMSSCPVLFAWNGREWSFISDLLGVGGIGYQVGAGEYSVPRPWERLLLPGDALRPRDNRYQLKLTEPMEEALYLDAARLVAWDLPQGWDLVLDERMAISDPQPSGAPLLYRAAMLPKLARNDRGQEVTSAVTAADLVAAPPGALDRRFIGRLAGEHVLTLRFPAALDHGPGQPVLVIDGWVEYPYSQTMFAAWQAKADYRAPTLEARAPGGDWVAVREQFGYPAGMPRRMSLPLSGLPGGALELRLTTNLEVYWDRIAVVWAEPCPAARRQVLEAVDAEVRYVGFPHRTSSAQRVPHYDYGRRAPLWDTHYQAGFYTELGPALELVTKTDDALAIIGAGEEIHLEYPAPATPPPTGWTRRFILEVEGWCKDMDLYTLEGDTIGPLPARGAGKSRRSELHARFNTRYQDGR